MGRGRKLSGWILILTGYLLSPLSWWNDLYLNIPLSYSFAWLASLIYEPAFLTVFIGFYWMTNIAGFIMLHKGAERVMLKKAGPYLRRGLLMDIAWSIAYSVMIMILVRMDIIRPPTDYFK